MKTSMIISLDDDVSAFLSQQVGQGDPSDYLNGLLRRQRQQEKMPVGGNGSDTAETRLLQNESEQEIPAAG